jgi:hypothetical protein
MERVMRKEKEEKIKDCDNSRKYPTLTIATSGNHNSSNPLGLNRNLFPLTPNFIEFSQLRDSNNQPLSLHNQDINVVTID